MKRIIIIGAGIGALGLITAGCASPTVTKTAAPTTRPAAHSTVPATGLFKITPIYSGQFSKAQQARGDSHEPCHVL
jgi:hypothetical protein